MSFEHRYNMSFFFFWNEEDNTRARVPKSPGGKDKDHNVKNYR